MAAAVLDPSLVRSKITSSGTNNGGATAVEGELVSGMTDLYAHFKSVAALVERHASGSGAKPADKLREKLLVCVEEERRMRAHVTALTALRGSYTATLEAFDFKSNIAASFDPALASEPPAKENKAVREFDKAVWQVRHPGEPMPGEDEDVLDVDEGTQNGGAVNQACPLSMVPVMQLKEPVLDQMNYCYEKSIVEQFIRSSRSHDGSVPCPQAGTNHKVRLADLRPAREILQLRRKQELLASQGGGSRRRDSGVMALDEDDDEDKL